ncbi:MAG: mechanosensitive ion channel [Magnetococcales bacterium]|nr:mechanosensitive ion channel [Magnetococcales bacterium]
MSGSQEGGKNKSRRRLFLEILTGALILGTILSLVASHFVRDRPRDRPLKLVVVAPLGGEHAAFGASIREGATLLVEQVNRAGGVHGRHLELVSVEESADAAVMGRALEAALGVEGVVAAVGHWMPESLVAALPYYRRQGIPVVTLAMGSRETLPMGEGVFYLSTDELSETRFLANYVRNITGEKIISIVRETGERGEAVARAFDETLQRFGTRVSFQWEVSPDPTEVDAGLARVVGEIKEQKLLGTIFFFGRTSLGARTLAAIRSEGLTNRFVGLRSLGTAAFLQHMGQVWKGKGSVQAAVHGTLTTTPLLFDTAGEVAQAFRNGYSERFSFSPDWVAAGSYDGVRMVASALRAIGVPAGEGAALEGLGKRLEERLLAYNGPGQAFTASSGPVFFDADRVAASQTMVGVYDGSNLVASLTQLWPIREEGVSNYLEEIVAGRALYVNDRFMYKTNVVYTGLRVEKIVSMEPENNVATLDLTIWFRWRGDFEPQDIVFTNAASVIRLEKPEREGTMGDMRYRSYRVKGDFFLNYSTAERAYGTHLVGATFRHRLLSRNNLMYVGDILGMGMIGGKSFTESVRGANLTEEQAGGGGGNLLQKVLEILAGGGASSDPLVELLTRSQVVSMAGWMVERAWVSQDIVAGSGEGDPRFVGFGKPEADFSRMDLGIVLKPDTFAVRDVIPPKYFLYIAIFALIGALLGSVLEGRDTTGEWGFHSFLLRLISWPLLLMAVGNQVLDYALRHLTPSNIDLIVQVYYILWWMVPARLLAIAVERFLWAPLERRTKRRIPNVVRMMTSLSIYLFASFGVVAFVFGKTITSLLATTGLTAMIIGLAVQANIANVFSGIILNIERPFSLGDFIKINTLIGQVVDITWRTIRIQSDDGQMVSLPNGKASEAEVHNFSRANGMNTNTNIYVHPRHEPERVLAIIEAAVAEMKQILRNTPEQMPSVYYLGVELVNGYWVSRFRFNFALAHLGKRNKALHELWGRLWEKFHQAGIDWHDLEREMLPLPQQVAAQAESRK